MKITEHTLDGLDQPAKLHLLELLLNDLYRQGIVSNPTLMHIASDVMLLEYQQEDDLLCFNCLDHEYEEE
ncbi:hypothetical protein LEM8419_03293 [Neolewinella maritima]|uniref:Alpha-carbonic anhydrase domain-containing protein n=1 Tax=Neolewinella maritima TaxID=1383882 RepID=A0ABN8F632_9BACT|nr:hypothetical protein [Neolewinella maritima]CAH1002400.1 hypothetical protein LEM8419_03293 [Neolewinella maritima]